VSLTTGRGALGPNPAGRFTADVPEGVAYVEPHPRRIQAVRGDATVIDTERALIVHRPGHPLRYLFLREDVGDLPHEPAPEAAGCVEVPWDAVEAWFEEGRRLVHYPPNPYHRIDCRPTRRRLRVEVAGTTLVDTDDTIILFETSLAPKLYVASAHVRTDLLRRTDTTTYCNYKGPATYWAAVVDGSVVDDVAWTYDDPLPESEPIRGWFSFDPERIDVVAELPVGAAVVPSGSERR
jgi:uncharacterized protein (DUF427 family)